MIIYNQIEKHLKKYRANDVKMLFELASHILLTNQDFDFVIRAKEEDLGPMLEEMTGQKITFSYNDIISEEEAKIYEEFLELDSHPRKLKKAERIELLAKMFSSDTLFEGFCLAFYGEEDILAQFCEDFGCGERYEILQNDPVYQKRKEYGKIIEKYTIAATNLYGYVHLGELIDILSTYEQWIKNYAKDSKDKKEYERKEGSYRQTLLFSPKWFCNYTLHQLVGNCIPIVASTMDGFLVHECFLNEVKEENEMIFEKLSQMSTTGQVGEELLDHAMEEIAEESFLHLRIFEAMEKEPYRPSQKEFLKYVDPDYYEYSLAQKQFEKFIHNKYLRNFARVAERLDITTQQCIDDFMKELHWRATDVGTLVDRDPQEYMQFVLAAAQGYGIPMERINLVNEFLGYAIRICNSVRLWRLHGHTPDEIHQRNPIKPDNITIVPGSTAMAQQMEENKKEFERMGFSIDIDGSADEIATFSMPSGLKGNIVEGKKKIYPNDPCPCGSGKKYKKCCGRNR